jgi:hypothetical protein
MSEEDKYQNSTSSALLEQLVYIDTFVNSNGSNGELTPNLNFDGQLSLDLAAFADDSFIFPDEEKPKNDDQGDDDPLKLDFNDEEVFRNTSDSNLPELQNINLESSNNNGALNNVNVANLPKFPVPPGAKSSLVSAGLSTNQIELLSTLVAQHQQLLGNPIPQENHQTNSNPIESSSSANAINSSNLGDDSGNENLSLSNAVFAPQLPSQMLYGQVRQHNSINVHRLDHLIDDQLHNIPSSNHSSNQRSPSLTNNSSDETLTNILGGGHTPNASVLSAELDKRRRNTAASARFRIKKKLKEKQMESKILQLNDVIKDFEVKIQQLQMENKLLRNLIIEKGSKKSDDELKVLKERAQRN